MATQLARRHTAADTATPDLFEHGYCILPNLVPADLVAALEADLVPALDRALFCRGDFYGERTKRIGSLLTRSPHAAAFIQHSRILEFAERALGPWCDTIQLNLTQAIELHPGAPRQLPHRDQDMWQASKGETEYLLNVMWPFTPYTEANGATLIYPRSHRAEALAEEDPGIPVAIDLEPGSALLFLGSTLHGAGANRSGSIRRGMIVSYCLGWLKPYENQWLAYPPTVARHFSPELAALVGYQQHRPNLGNYEGRCPSLLLRDRLPERMGAVDALRPDQAELVAAYRRNLDAGAA